MAQPKPCPVVLPIPHHHRTEISAKSNLWYAPQGQRQEPAGTLRSKGYRMGRGARYARPCACVSEHSSQVECGECCRAVERESGHPHSSRIPGPDTQLHRAALLGQGRLCEDGRLRGGRHPAVHPQSGGARETRRAIGVGGSHRGGKARTLMGRVQGGPQPPAGASCTSALGEGLLSRRPLRGQAITVPSEEGFLPQCPRRGHTITAPPFRGASSNHPLCGW